MPQQQYAPPVQQYLDNSIQGPPDEAHGSASSQMQWVTGAKLDGNNSEYNNDSNNYTENGMQQQQPGMQIQAGGQRMVLDLNEYVQGVDDFYGIDEQGNAIMAS